ncbi:MAG TPA: sulfatase, partial [Actinomycetospora sp.]
MTTVVRPRAAQQQTAGTSRGGWRKIAAGMTTGAAGLLVFLALIAPQTVGQLTPGALLRIPVEGLLGVVLVLVLPAGARRAAATLGGVVLGLLTILKILDYGFGAVLARPFDPVLDWTLTGDAAAFLTASLGRAG